MLLKTTKLQPRRSLYISGDSFASRVGSVVYIFILLFGNLRGIIRQKPTFGEEIRRRMPRSSSVSATTSMDVASSASTRTRRSSLSQLVLQIAVLALVMCSRFTTTDSLPLIGDNTAAAAAGLNHYNRFDELSKRNVVDGVNRQQLDLSSTSLCRNSFQSVGLRLFCRSAQLHPQHQSTRLVRRSGDASSLSAFQRLVTRLRQYQTARDQVEDELHRLRSMGVVDSNNQVVQIPNDMAEMMARVG